jgi:hypothetical protein
MLLPHIMIAPPGSNIKSSAITFEYLKVEILNISKLYVVNLRLNETGQGDGSRTVSLSSDQLITKVSIHLRASV